MDQSRLIFLSKHNNNNKSSKSVSKEFYNFYILKNINNRENHFCNLINYYTSDNSSYYLKNKKTKKKFFKKTFFLKFNKTFLKSIFVENTCVLNLFSILD